MANIMTKRGNLDNIVTYEHICDTVADMQNIDPRTATLGSICIVIKGENDNLEVYIADSNKEWNMLSTNSGGSGSDVGVGIHICGNDEYDSTTGKPTIEDPIENQFYLVPSSGSDSSNLFDEWIYIDEKWEKFGGGSIDIPEQVQANWNENDDTKKDFIQNKPPIKAGTGINSTIVNILSNNIASGEASYAEGGSTIASGDYSHAEGGATKATGSYSHAEGANTQASGIASHSEGIQTRAIGDQSHAEGLYTIANHSAQHVFGVWNLEDDSSNTAGLPGNYVEIVGNGTGRQRSNARTLDWSGNEWLAGNLTLNQTTLTESELQRLSDLNIVSMTKAEYDSLSEEEKMNGTVRFITDSEGELIFTKSALGLGNVDNTSDINKPVSIAQRQAIDAISTKTVEVSGTDLNIKAVSNTRYICGEVSSLDFTPSITGISDIVFTSGSSKTILTLPDTVKMPNGFEIETNMIYEINIADGIYGVVASWAI